MKRKVVKLLFGGFMWQKQIEDSTGKPIFVGDRVRFRSKIYTIKEFHPGKGLHGTAQITFVEKQHTPEIADGVSVDLVEGTP